MATAEGVALENDKATIFEASKACEALFDITTKLDSPHQGSLELSGTFKKWALNQSASFRLWVESIGAFARWSASADARLQNNENMKAAVMGLLDVLQLNLRQTIEAYKDPGFTKSILDENLRQVHNSLEKELSYLTSDDNDNDDDDDDEIEAEPTTLALSKGVSSSEVGDQDEDDSINLTNSDGDSTTGSQFRPDHEVESVLTRLHQLLLTIRSSRRFNWTERASKFIYPGSEDFRKYMEWYINERFRNEYPEVLEFICKRLLLANIKRRNQFEYAREHALKLAVDKTRSTSGQRMSSTPPKDEKRDDMSVDTLSHRDISSSRPDAPSVALSKSVPSTRATDYRDASFERSETGTVSISSGETFKDGQLTWPSPPKAPYINLTLPSFPCRYCRSPLPIECCTGRNSKKKWRQHVKNDIQPYVCLFEECSTPLKLYSRSADWINHMRSAHGEMGYACFAPKHERERVFFRTPESYKNHLMQAHPKTFVESEFGDLLVRSRCRIPLDPIFRECPICPGPEKHSILEKRKQPETAFSLPRSLIKRTKVDETLTSRMQVVRIHSSTRDDGEDDGEDDSDDDGEDHDTKHRHLEEARLLHHIMEHLQYIALMALPWAENLGSARSSSVSVGRALDHSNDNVVPEDHEGPVNVEVEELPYDPTYYGGRDGALEWGFIKNTGSPKEARQPNKQGFYRDGYAIAWICSRPLDLRIASAMLDTVHDNFPRYRFDPNNYVLGTVGDWNIVIAHHDLETSRGPLIVDLNSAFPNIELFLSVGVSGVVPWNEFVLGDVVVDKGDSAESRYPFGPDDLEHYTWNGKSEIRILPSTESLQEVDLQSVLSSFEEKESTLAMLAVYPGLERDIAFEPGYLHVGNHPNCDYCDPSQQITYRSMPDRHTSPRIRVGQIAFMPHSETDLDFRVQDSEFPRGRFSAIDGSLQGLYTTRNAMPILIVRGVSDYADSHKPDFWKNYASTAAGAFVKALLLQLTNIKSGTIHEPTAEVVTLTLGSGGHISLFQPAPPSSREEFKIAIFCALPLEANAVLSMFDEEWNDYGKLSGDFNAYTTGAIGRHNVVLVHLPNMGTSSAGESEAFLRMSYPGVELILLVGICGAAPTAGGREVALGDVFISTDVVQFDFEKQYPASFSFEPFAVSVSSDWLPNGIRSILSKLKTRRGRVLEAKMNDYLQGAERAERYPYPGRKFDRLYRPSYLHKHHSAVKSCDICNSYVTSICEEARATSCENLGCEDAWLVHRTQFTTTEGSDDADNGHVPRVHFGTIASGDSIIESADRRDMLAEKYGAVAFDIEATEVGKVIPTVIIKGACDYADGHRNKIFQRYAAASAAACMKAFLAEVPHLRRTIGQGIFS